MMLQLCRITCSRHGCISHSPAFDRYTSRRYWCARAQLTKFLYWPQFWIKKSQNIFKKLPENLLNFVMLNITIWSSRLFWVCWLNFRLFRTNLYEKQSSRPAIKRPGLESQRSRKRLFFHRNISNTLNLNLICIYMRYKNLKLSTSTPVGNVSYLIH